MRFCLTAQWALVREMVGVILDGRLGYIYGVLVSFIVCCQDINIMWLIKFFLGIQTLREEASLKLLPCINQVYCTDSETLIIKESL